MVRWLRLGPSGAGEFLATTDDAVLPPKRVQEGWLAKLCCIKRRWSCSQILCTRMIFYCFSNSEAAAELLALRLPVSKDMRTAKINDILADLNMESCSEVKCGSLSGSRRGAPSLKSFSPNQVFYLWMSRRADWTARQHWSRESPSQPQSQRSWRYRDRRYNPPTKFKMFLPL